MKDAFVSYTVHADRSAEVRKQRLMREAGLFEREVESSPLHLALLVAVVITVLGGATAFMEDGAMAPGAISATAQVATR